MPVNPAKAARLSRLRNYAWRFRKWRAFKTMTVRAMVKARGYKPPQHTRGGSSNYTIWLDEAVDPNGLSERS